MNGILITEGVTFSIGQITITTDAKTGNVSIEGAQPTMHYDVCPTWLAIAVQHLAEAKQARDQLMAAEKVQDVELRNLALEREFRASMQAIMSSAIAIDALYAVLKSKLKPDSEPFDPKNRGAARFAQVSELLRQTFQLKPAGFKVLREAIQQIFQYRDEAAHPTGNSTEPVLHPALNVAVERRLVVFRFENAVAITRTAVDIISDLATKGNAKNTATRDYSKSLSVRVESIRAEPILGLPPLA